MTPGGECGTLPGLVPLSQTDVELLIRHLKRLRQLVDELDGLDLAPSTFHQRQDVRDRLRRELDVSLAAVMSFGPGDPDPRPR
jgi:hypothetical protein